jgi:hypothetical protein
MHTEACEVLGGQPELRVLQGDGRQARLRSQASHGSERKDLHCDARLAMSSIIIVRATRSPKATLQGET